MPYNSASLYPSPEALADSRPKGLVYSAMLQHLLWGLHGAGVRGKRLDVDFHLAGLSLDQTLGRAAHLQYLLDANFVERLLCTYLHYFVGAEAVEEGHHAGAEARAADGAAASGHGHVRAARDCREPAAADGEAQPGPYEAASRQGRSSSALLDC